METFLKQYIVYIVVLALMLGPFKGCEEFSKIDN
jgi:hypothetical protein